MTAEGYACAIGGGAYIAENTYGCDAITIDSHAITHLSKQLNNPQNCIEKITAVQPQTAAVEAGETVSLSVEGSYGFSGLSYQWQSSSDNSSWSDLPGETDSVLQTALTEENDGQFYRCVLTNGWSNTVYTNSARVFSLKQPASAQLTEADDQAVLDASAGIDDAAYQWKLLTGHR